MVLAARSVLGTPYQFGGRLRPGATGIDCQGVVFFAAEAIGRCGWKSFAVNPTETVLRRELGVPVKGLAPVRSDQLDIGKLQMGDVLMLVAPDRNPLEGPIGQLDGGDVWVWHVGVYSGNGKWIVGDHFAGRAIETHLAAYLTEHARTYRGVFVTRMEKGPAPARCRRHPPMGEPPR